MYATLKWTLHRIFRNKRTYIFLLVLAGCSILVSGGISRHWSKDFDVGLLNISYGVAFSTMEEFLDWYRPFQYQWLVSATGMTVLLPVLANLFPSFSSQEAAVPVVMGRTRSQIFLSGLIIFYLEALLLWIFCFLVGFLLGGMSPVPVFSAGYYIRTVGIALWLFWGFAGLSLSLALLFQNRLAGIMISFIIIIILNMSRNTGLFRGTFFNNILYANGGRTDLWMWSEKIIAAPSELLTVALFPIATTLLACAVGLVQFHRRDLCGNGGEFL